MIRTLHLKNDIIIKSYNLDDHPITLSTVTNLDTGIRVGSGTLNLLL